MTSPILPVAVTMMSFVENRPAAPNQITVTVHTAVGRNISGVRLCQDHARLAFPLLKLGQRVPIVALPASVIGHIEHIVQRPSNQQKLAIPAAHA